jgi:pyruvate,water dikinase
VQPVQAEPAARPRWWHGLAAALDDLGDRAAGGALARALLEDRFGTAFSGKYKSLFLPNQGTKRERLEAMLDAIAEIYASVFGPDPIAYRRERGLTDLHEEMGILIQEVVGRRVGRYFFPAFAGVAFSNNEFRWSPRLEREDGLVRLVPGLGTRAVDRVGDDYPVLLVPAKPQLRANSTVDEILRYAPRCLDALNLETRRFETVEIDALLKEYGEELPWLDRVFSVYEPPDVLRRASNLLCDPKRDKLVATFEGLVAKTPFLEQLRGILELLEHALDTPVDIEFACDGDSLYLLQCRPQSYGVESAPAPIPVDIAEERILFSAQKHVSNGALPPVTHIVYVDPEGYSSLGSREEMLAVGRAVGQLNKVLPKRQFILLGPGRWGSRGDIKLGVG